MNWWHSKVTWRNSSQLNHFYWRFNQLDCFNSNWRQKCPSMRKLLCAGPKHFDQLKSKPGPTRKARPNLQLCAAVTTLKMVGDAIVTFKCLWCNYGDVVVWWYNTRKFLVFNHAKLPKIECKSPVCSSRAGLKPMQLHWSPCLCGPGTMVFR